MITNWYFLAISENTFSVSLLKIDGVDARSLAEIKRRRIYNTLSIYFGVATTQMRRIFSKDKSFINTANSI